MPIISLMQKKNNKKTYHQDNIAISYKRKPLQFEGAAFKIKKMDTSGCSQEEKNPWIAPFSLTTPDKKRRTLCNPFLFFNSR